MYTRSLSVSITQCDYFLQGNNNNQNQTRSIHAFPKVVKYWESRQIMEGYNNGLTN
jgi:hypothetical protein